jgi:hypothetical protein
MRTDGCEDQQRQPESRHKQSDHEHDRIVPHAPALVAVTGFTEDSVRCDNRMSERASAFSGSGLWRPLEGSACRLACHSRARRSDDFRRLATAHV